MTDINSEIEQLRVLNHDLQQKIAELETRLQEKEILGNYWGISTPVFIQDVSTGKILDANEAMLKSFGFASKEAALASSLNHFITGNPPFTETEALRRIQLAAGGQPQVFDWPAKKVTGETFWVEVSLQKSPAIGENHILAVVRDINKRKRAENALHESEEILSAIFNAVPVRISWKDRDLTYLGCNRAFALDFGFKDPQDIIGKNDYDLAWGHDQVEQCRADDRLVIERGEARLFFDEEQTTPSGDKVHLLASKVPLRDAAGNIIGVLSTYENITERRNVEEELTNTRLMLASAFEQTPIPMVLVSMPDRILRIVNTACRQILGIMDEPTTVGRKLREFKPSYLEYDVEGNLIPLTDAPLVRALNGQETHSQTRKIVTKKRRRALGLGQRQPYL